MLPALQRKFIRKKQRPPPAVTITTKDYDLHLSPEERYRRHFVMWDFWHAEILEGLGESRKKALRAAEESLAELAALRSLLLPPMAEKVNPHMARLEQLRQDLSKDVLTGMALQRWRSTVEQQQRVIRRELAWKGVQDFVVSLEPAGAGPP